MQSYRDLEIYKQSKSLAIKVHAMTLTLPRFEMFEEGSQVRRSSKAITAAVVEGYGRRRYKLDFSKYLVLAQAECDETILHLEFLHETKSLTDDNLFHELKSAYETLGKMITRFHQWMDQNWKTPNQ